MQKKNILVIGRNEDILSTVVRLINSNEEWRAIGSTSDEDAMKIFEIEEIDLVMLTSGLKEESEQQLREQFRMQKPAIRIVQHYGGGSGLLANEIRQAFEQL